MSDQGIQIPDGTIVNGQPFKKYAELQARIIELEAKLKKLKPEPSIPDWIAWGKWVENTYTDGTKYNARISKVDGERVIYSKVNGLDRCSWDYLDRVIKLGKPFTPPPIPELPEGFQWFYGDLVHVNATKMTLEAWITSMNLSPRYWTGSTINTLNALSEWREKWGN